MIYRLMNIAQANGVGKLGFGHRMCLMRYFCAPIVKAFHPSIHFLPSPQHRSRCSSFLAQPCFTSLTAAFPMAEVSRYLPLPASRLAISSMLLLPQQDSLQSSLRPRLPLRQSNGLARAIWFLLVCARSCANQQNFLTLQHRLRCVDHSLKELSSIFLIQKSRCSFSRSCHNSLIQIADHQRCSRSYWDQRLF